MTSSCLFQFTTTQILLKNHIFIYVVNKIECFRKKEIKWLTNIWTDDELYQYFKNVQACVFTNWLCPHFLIYQRELDEKFEKTHTTFSITWISNQMESLKQSLLFPFFQASTRRRWIRKDTWVLTEAMPLTRHHPGQVISCLEFRLLVIREIKDGEIFKTPSCPMIL